MVGALFVNSPLGGCVESVVTLATQRFFFPELFFPDSIRNSFKLPVRELVHEIRNSGPTGNDQLAPAGSTKETPSSGA